MNIAIMTTSLRTLQARLQGEVICPGDEGYDRARRVWNGRIDRSPYGIVYCTGPEDVRTAIDFNEHSDLFWGVRGGGGNFGVATTMVFQLHPVDRVLAGKITYPLSQARDILRFYREFTLSAPDELTAYAALNTTSHNIPIISISLCYAGSVASGERLVAPLRTVGSPLAANIQPRPYLQAALLPYTLKGVYINFLGEEGEEQVRASYGVNYERLVALKNTYDPDNFFHFNQNIKPTVRSLVDSSATKGTRAEKLMLQSNAIHI